MNMVSTKCNILSFSQDVQDKYDPPMIWANTSCRVHLGLQLIWATQLCNSTAQLNCATNLQLNCNPWSVWESLWIIDSPCHTKNNWRLQGIKLKRQSPGRTIFTPVNLISSILSYIYSSNHMFIYSILHSFVQWYIYSLNYQSIRSIVCHFYYIMNLFVKSYIILFNHKSIHPIVYHFIQTYIYHSVVRP